ncbi:MAG TPA: lipoate--protein ligase family protein [Anaerolineales bacterium]
MTYPRQSWRLLITPPAHGAWNMAVDEALLEAIEQSETLPCLRLYAWEPACLSLGYAQPSADIDFTRLIELGYEWVRRPTGGRAILHTDELTYSVIAPISDPRVAGGVLESYQRLSVALLAALHSLGIPAEAHPTKSPVRGQDDAAVCFEVPSNYEIVVAGKKIIGSAQARRKNNLLQHGTFPLWGDLTRITRVLTFEDEDSRQEAAARLLSHATTAETILGHKLPWLGAAQAFISSFTSELDLDLTPSELTSQERERADILGQEKYRHPSWLRRI